MHDVDRVRALLDSLDADERERVYGVFAYEIERGVVPKPVEVEAVIWLVRAVG